MRSSPEIGGGKEAMFQARCVLGFFVVGFVLVGCGPSALTPADATASGQEKGPKFTGPPSDAGLPVPPSTDAKGFTKLVSAKSGMFVSRANPFALTGREKSFDTEQFSERLFNSTGFTTMVESVPEVAPDIYQEPQPYRRLSGIVVGDSVVAIIEMGDGQNPEIIRPGMKIPNSPWTVVSIDQDKATLRRSGNVLPHEIQVRLETPPAGYQTPGFGGGGAPGGFPGAPGGGRQGGNGGPGAGSSD